MGEPSPRARDGKANDRFTRCHNCAAPLTKEMETSQWTVPPLVRDSFSMIGSAVGGTAASFYGFNYDFEISEKMTGAKQGAGEEIVTLDLLKKKMDDFAKERDWEKYHAPRNLLLAMVGEVGELSEIFQWKGEVPKGLPDWKEEEKVHLGEELSDVLLYLVRLSDMCGIDLGKAALRKIELNAVKYPASLCNKKYNDGDNSNDAINGAD